jgi:hypothetical protein
MALRRGFATAILLLLAGLPTTNYAEPNKVEYELQERCARGASEFFQKQYGNGVEANGGGGETYTYFVNHYNARLNKCFISFTRYAFFTKNPSKSTAKFRNVVDINESREYGHYSDLSPLDCIVQTKVCHSEAEWEALIKPYMDEAD